MAKKDRKILPKTYVFIDAEWGSDKTYICVQALVKAPGLKSVQFMIFHEKYRELLAQEGYEEEYIQLERFYLSFSDFSKSEDRLTPCIYNFFPINQEDPSEADCKCNLYLFFSPKDLSGWIGDDQFDKFASAQGKNPICSIIQKRSLSSSFCLDHKNSFKTQYKIKDVSGWANSELKNLM